MGDPPAPVVPGDRKAPETERRHRLDLVAGGGALAMAFVVLAVGRVAAVAVSAQVARHHGEPLGEPGRHLAPHDAGLRVAVKQQQRRAGAADDKVDLAFRGGHAPPLEPLERHARLPFRAAPPPILPQDGI